MVASVECGGLIEHFNNRSPDAAIREGDVIVDVNGVVGSCKTVRKMILARRLLDFRIERGRPEVEWTVDLEEDLPVGCLEFDAPSHLRGSTLRVARVGQASASPSPASGRSGHSVSSIRRGDLIMQVNGESTSAATMAAELRRVQPSTLRVSRKKVTRAVKFGEDFIDDVFSLNSDSDCETPVEPGTLASFAGHHMKKHVDL
jgi:hypothetical protein